MFTRVALVVALFAVSAEARGERHVSGRTLTPDTGSSSSGSSSSGSSSSGSSSSGSSSSGSGSSHSHSGSSSSGSSSSGSSSSGSASSNSGSSKSGSSSDCDTPAPAPTSPPTPPTPPCNPINTEEAVVRDLWRPTAVNSLPAYAVSENTLGWTLGDDQVTLHNFPPVLLKDGVRAFYPDQTSEIPLGAEIQVECPANCDDTPCEVIVVTYHCVPCSSATNGKFPATMPLAGWAPGHCSPRFSFLADKHRMVGFRKLVDAGETEVLPATEVALSNIAVFVRQGAHDCGLFGQEMCDDSNECAWKDGACSSTWCPAAIPTGPPTCTPCAQTEIDLD